MNYFPRMLKSAKFAYALAILSIGLWMAQWSSSKNKSDGSISPIRRVTVSWTGTKLDNAQYKMNGQVVGINRSGYISIVKAIAKLPEHSIIELDLSMKTRLDYERIYHEPPKALPFGEEHREADNFGFLCAIKELVIDGG